MGRDTFDKLVALLATNKIFTSPYGHKPQRHVKWQLAAFLFRYGRLGTDSLDVAQKLGIGHGTVIKYCQRVSRALRELRPRYLKWPDQVRREEIAAEFEDRSGFPKCVGSLDGTLFKFCDEPDVDGEVFLSRKKTFSVCVYVSVIVSYFTDIFA